MRAVVEQVIQTATRLLNRDLESQEVVTILATLSRDAAPAAVELRRSEPERADSYQELLGTLAQQLRERSEQEGDTGLQTVVEDLARVQRSLA